jgi:hypothetical protein
LRKRIALGFEIPTLLVAHAVKTSLAFAYGAQAEQGNVLGPVGKTLPPRCRAGASTGALEWTFEMLLLPCLNAGYDLGRAGAATAAKGLPLSSYGCV